MNERFEHVIMAGPCSGSAGDHSYWADKCDRERLEKFEAETDITSIEYGGELIIHNEKDSHTLITTFHTTIESDMVAFKLWWL